MTHFIRENLEGNGKFEPVRFNGWPELKEAFLAGHLDATFLLAPMAISLREDGVPVKIIYLGHRDGSALMVHKDSSITRMKDLKGKTIAVPSRFANQRLLIFKALRDQHMSIADVNLLEMPPPDMPAALAVRSVDAITSGEPFMAQTEVDGYGRVLYLTKDIWPGFISCVLAVREDTIQKRRPELQALVDGIAKSGLWVDKSMNHRMQAAEFVSTHYYNQHPKLLAFALRHPPDRVKYTDLRLLRKNWEEIEEVGRIAGTLKGTAHYEDYCDDSFSRGQGPDALRPWDFEWKDWTWERKK